MKKQAIVIVLLLSGISVFAQVETSKVPAVVKAGFTKKYPAAQVTGWEMEDKNYEVAFKNVGQKLSAIFSNQGTWIETEMDIRTNQLPLSALSYLQQNYKDAKIKEAAYIQKATGKINYEAEVNGSDLIFDTKGSFIKVVKD